MSLRQREALRLCAVPIQIAQADAMLVRLFGSTQHATCRAQQKSRCSKHGHLRVVGDLSNAVIQLVFRDAALTVSPENLALFCKLHCLTEGVTHSTADQTAAKLALFHLHQILPPLFCDFSSKNRMICSVANCTVVGCRNRCLPPSISISSAFGYSLAALRE